jgi:NADH-quinone oxidoreductase subunit M
MMPALPVATTFFAPYILMFAVGGVIYAGIVAIMQKDMKRLFAYVSLAHISLMVAGIFSLTTSGIQGAFTQAFSHGFNTVALFICADIIQNRVGTTELSKLGGIRKQAPRFVTAFFIIMFATAAIPFSNSFIGEMVTLYGVFQYSAVWSLIAAFSLVLGAVFMLRMFRQAVLGPHNNNTAGFKDLCGTEVMSIYPFVILVFVFGLVYQPIFDLVDDSVLKVINQLTLPTY